jgi:hypothetical protein
VNLLFDSKNKLNLELSSRRNFKGRNIFMRFEEKTMLDIISFWYDGGFDLDSKSSDEDENKDEDENEDEDEDEDYEGNENT